MRDRAVVFDWGGVLMRTEDYTPRHRWDAKLGLPTGAVEKVVHGIPEWGQVQQGQITLDAYWRAVQRRLGLDVEETAALAQGFYRGDRLDADLVTLIRELRRSGVRVALLSNNISALAGEIEELGLGEMFRPQVISADIGVMKPAAGAYQAVLDQLDVDAGNTLFIDDSPANVEGACAVGMHALLFRPDMDLANAVQRWLNGAGDE